MQGKGGTWWANRFFLFTAGLILLLCGTFEAHAGSASIQSNSESQSAALIPLDEEEGTGLPSDATDGSLATSSPRWH